MMKWLESEQITEAVAGLCVETNLRQCADISNALLKAREGEPDPGARDVLDLLLKNAAVAATERLPLCQDTGMAVVFLSVGQDVHINGDLTAAVNEGVRRGYREAFLRASVVRDPIRRENTGDNTPAVVHYTIIPGDAVHITVAPKGFGSENMSAVNMLPPSAGLEGVEDFVTETVRAAGANPCPPVIVGVGIGGTMEMAALMAKRALLRPVGTPNPDPFWADAEKRLLTRINDLGIGPAGFGGRTTALGVQVEIGPTHIAGLPVAVNVGCHATRHGTVIL